MYAVELPTRRPFSRKPTWVLHPNFGAFTEPDDARY